MADSITITDNRTGRTVEVPLVDGTVSAKAWSSLLPGIWFDDPSFSATSGADSAITFLDGGRASFTIGAIRLSSWLSGPRSLRWPICWSATNFRRYLS